VKSEPPKSKAGVPNNQFQLFLVSLSDYCANSVRLAGM